MAVLLISILFLMVPGVIVFADDLFDFASFKQLGPFYMLGLLLSGLCNSVTYLTLHSEIRLAAKTLLCRSIMKQGLSTTEVFTI